MAKKQSTNGTSQNGIITTGIDVGFGITKALRDNAAPIQFPSVWGVSRDLSGNFQRDKINETYAGDIITDEDGEWFIGELAQNHLTAAEHLRLRGRTANEQTIGNPARVRLAKVALGKMFPGLKNGEVVHLRAGTGLPVKHMRGAADLKAALIGQHHIKTNATDFVANITDVYVMPQPYGTIYRESLTPAGEINPCHTATRTAVLDVGTFTVDLAVDNDGEYVDAESDSVEVGTYTAQQRIAAAIDRDHKQTPKYSTVETVLRTGCLKAKGKTYDYSEEVKEALEPLRNGTLAKMNELWQAGNDIDVIYVSGGGAELVFKTVKAAYPHAVLVENSQLANAQGYLNYTNWRAKE